MVGSTATLLQQQQPEQVVMQQDDDGEDAAESLRSPSVAAKRRGKRGQRRKDKSVPPSTSSANPSFTSLLDHPPSSPAPPLPQDIHLTKLAAAVEQSASEISRSTRSTKASSVHSGRTGRSSRMSATEKALARMPPMPSQPPPAPPGKASVDKIRTTGRRINDLENDASSPPATTPEISLDPSYVEMHPGAAAILASPPVRKSWTDKFKFGTTTTTTNNNNNNNLAPTPHAAPSAHESPATLAHSKSKSSLRSETTTATTTMAGNVKSIVSSLDPPPRSSRSTTSSKATEQANATMRAASLAVGHPGMQWMSDEEEVQPMPTRRPVVNDLEIVSPLASSQANRRPVYTTAEDERRMPPPPRLTSSALSSSRPPQREMDRNWRSSVISNSTTTTSSGAMSIANSAGTLSSASSTYTRFDNGSVRSLSTMATSVSGGSHWRVAKDGMGGNWRAGPPSSSDGHSIADPDAPGRPRKQPQRTNVKSESHICLFYKVLR